MVIYDVFRTCEELGVEIDEGLQCGPHKFKKRAPLGLLEFSSKRIKALFIAPLVFNEG